MALIKPIVLNDGVTCDYWRYSGNGYHNIIEGEISLYFALYVNKQARLDGRKPRRVNALRVFLDKAKYQQYLGASVVDSEGWFQQVYLAAKNEIGDMEEGSGRFLDDAIEDL